jgi:hypothetical protein
MSRHIVPALLIAAIAVGSLPLAIDGLSVEAAAQGREARPNFFQRLFGVRPEPPPVVRKQVIRKSRKKTVKKPRSRPSKPPVAIVEVQPKDPDARKLLVIGDFVAGGLAWGLEQKFAEEPKVTVIDRSKGDSGLVRADNYDWNMALLKTLNEAQPDLIVLAFGANDRQPVRGNGERDPLRSNTWRATYTQRITGIVDTLKVYGRPFFWMGAPPMRATTASSDMAYFNSLYEPRVEAGGGHFVDIWNGFSNKDGGYVASGPDVEGQVRQLRTRDGINFTRAGQLKLAFYIEQEIRRQTGFGSGHIDLLATLTQGNQIELAPDGTKILVGPIISLNDPAPGLSVDLAGGTPASPPGEDSPQYNLIVRGAVLPEVPGRVDDFLWPPRKETVLLPKPTAPKPVAEATMAPVPVARPQGVTN